MTPPLDDAQRVEQIGTRLITGLFAAGLVATLALASIEPMALPVLPVVVVALAAAASLLRRPVAGLVTALVLSAGLSGYSESPVSLGFEVLFVAYSVVYLTLWYSLRLVRGQRIVSSGLDALVAVLLVGGLVGGCVLGLVMGARLEMLVGEARSFAMLAFYFPIREVTAEREGGATAVTGGLLAVGVSAVGWNSYITWSAFQSADQLWQIIDVRSAYGETSLTASLLLSLALLLTARSRREWLGLAVIVGLVLVGLVMTKSRGFWAAGLLGLLLMGACLPGSERKRLVTSGTAVLLVGVALSVALFGQYVQLLAVGIAKRFLTLGSATTADVSLINRFLETRAAWDRIVENPILGYGFGVPFARYDLVYGGTIDWAFVHNGYVGTWYKIGLWGLFLVVSVWTAGIWRGAQSARNWGLATREQALGAGAAGVLLALAVAANTSNPFMLADQTLVLTVVLGLAHGVADRAAARRPTLAGIPPAQ